MRVRNTAGERIGGTSQTERENTHLGAEKVSRGGPPPGVTRRPTGKMAAAIVPGDRRTRTPRVSLSSTVRASADNGKPAVRTSVKAVFGVRTVYLPNEEPRKPGTRSENGDDGEKE